MSPRKIQITCLTRLKNTTPPKKNSAMLWLPLEKDYLILNTDAIQRARGIHFGLGGVLRNSSGTWILGFAKKLPRMDTLLTEARALEEGLVLASSLQASCLDAHLDTQVLVKLLEGFFPNDRLISPIIEHCRCLSSNFRNIKICHVNRLVNGVVDKLAKLALHQDLPTYLNFPPEGISEELHKDFFWGDFESWSLCYVMLSTMY